MSRLAVHQSSARGDWRTPSKLLELVRQLGTIVLDPCGGPGDLVAALVSWHGPGGLGTHRGDGLTLSWVEALRCHRVSGGLAYCNPEYGRHIGAWVGKAIAEAALGVEIVMLLPARTDTVWFPWQADGLCFLRGRLTFEGAAAPAPFPSLVAYYGPRTGLFRSVFAPHGALVLRPGRRAA